MPKMPFFWLGKSDKKPPGTPFQECPAAYWRMILLALRCGIGHDDRSAHRSGTDTDGRGVLLMVMVSLTGVPFLNAQNPFPLRESFSFNFTSVFLRNALRTGMLEATRLSLPFGAFVLSAVTNGATNMP